MFLILFAAQIAIPADPPTFMTRTARSATDVALCYAEQFGRQKALSLSTERQSGSIVMTLNSRAFFKQTREGTIKIDDQGADRAVSFWLRRVKGSPNLPPHLRQCVG